MAGPIAVDPKCPEDISMALSGAQKLFRHGDLIIMSGGSEDSIAAPQREMAAQLGDYLYDIDKGISALDAKCGAVIRGILAKDEQLKRAMPVQPDTHEVAC